jgi:hypothetical protein
VVARRTAKDTALLIEEVARGDRLLEEIKEPALRETVRLALRLHKDPFAAPDAAMRNRIRIRVLRSLRPHGATIADRVFLAFEVLAKPTPYTMRFLALALVVTCIGASTMVVSAGSVTTDALYTVKIASEQARLALATTPEDRAIVELSIAEHRLAEATSLADSGSDDDAIVATSEYGEHLANAAAELAQVELMQPETATLVTQLQLKIDEHRLTAAAAVARLENLPARAPAMEVLAVLAGPGAATGDLTPAAAIAQQAASAADRIASVAERAVARPNDVGDDEAAASVESESGREREVAKVAATKRNETSRPSATSRGERAAEGARRAADEAKSAAKKAKEGSRRTPSPKARHH